MKLDKSIQAYAPAVRVILGWMPDWLHQDEFDRRARAERPFDGWVSGYTPDTVLLNPYQKELGLLHEMQRFGLVKAKRGPDGKVLYRAAKMRRAKP